MAETMTASRRAGLAAWPARAVMSQPVVAVCDSTSLSDVLRTMHATGLRHLAVMDGTGRCLGVLCDRLVAGAWALYPSGMDRIRASDVVTTTVSVMPVDTVVADVAAAMRRHRVDAIVLVDCDTRPLGLITAADLVALLAKPAR
jgi:CBS domain-containing protein